MHDHQHQHEHQEHADRDLLSRVASGDRAALESLYLRHADWLTHRLQSRCGDPDLADLAVQDTFVAVWRSAGKFRGDGDVGAWIWGIGIRRLIDHRRKRRPAPIDTSAASIGESVWASASMVSSEDLVIDGFAGPAHAALDRLEPDLRTVMVLTAIDGLTTKEASRLLGIPQGTVKTRMMRARGQLATTLTGAR